MAKFLLIIFIKMCIFFQFCVLAHDCVNNSNQFKCKFGTMTPYRFVANYNDSQLNYPGCIEKKIWLIIRHGTRNPKSKHIHSMIYDLPKLKEKIIKSLNNNNSQLPNDVINNIANWKPCFKTNEAMFLTQEGENELIDLAERMQARFPTIFLQDYNDTLYKFKYTATQRTEISAKSFALGLFGQQYIANILYPEPEHKDPILRFYKNCERWQIEVRNNSETYKETNLFLQSDIVQHILSSVSKRVGFNIDFDSVYLIYLTCAFETALKEGTKSPWCDILSFDDIQVLEYIQDLKYYWKDGYGYQLNYEQACPAIRDMFQFFESDEKGLATVYFTHSGTILKLLSILGIAKDNHSLTYKSFFSHKGDRNWKVSLIDNFASNIAFILYDCKTHGPSVLLLHQEREVQIPGCSEMLCPVSIVKDHLPDKEEECQFDHMCSIGPKQQR